MRRKRSRRDCTSTGDRFGPRRPKSPNTIVPLKGIHVQLCQSSTKGVRALTASVSMRERRLEVRLRGKVGGRRVVSPQSIKQEGLRTCWVLLRPYHSVSYRVPLPFLATHICSAPHPRGNGTNAFASRVKRHIDRPSRPTTARGVGTGSLEHRLIPSLASTNDSDVDVRQALASRDRARRRSTAHKHGQPSFLHHYTPKQNSAGGGHPLPSKNLLSCVPGWHARRTRRTRHRPRPRPRPSTSPCGAVALSRG